MNEDGYRTMTVQWVSYEIPTGKREVHDFMDFTDYPCVGWEGRWKGIHEHATGLDQKVAERIWSGEEVPMK